MARADQARHERAKGNGSGWLKKPKPCCSESSKRSSGAPSHFGPRPVQWAGGPRFSLTIHPVGNPSRYADSKRFGVISDPRDRKAVTQLRTGQVDCAVERRKWNSRGGLECSCGCLVGDPYHTVMECPHTYANRLAVYDRIREHAASDSDLGGLLAHTMDSVLLASLGALLPGEGAAPDAPLYTTLIRLAAPEWAKAFTSWINEILPRGHLKCRRGQVRSLSVAHNGSMFPP